jgi:hypothetical protein
MNISMTLVAEAIAVLSRMKGAGARLALEQIRLTYGMTNTGRR